MAIQGIVTLDGDEIGIFTLNDKGGISIVLNKIANSVEDVLEFATENGMTLALTLQPSFEDYIPQHKQGLDTLP